MAVTEYTKTDATALWDFQEVRSYLEGHGYVIGPAGLGTAFAVVGGVPTAIVRIDLDPHVSADTLAADLDEFAPAPDPVREAQAALVVAMARLRGLPAGATVDDRLAAHEAVIMAYAATQGV